MLLPVLVAVFLLPAQAVSTPCANIATTQTQPVRGRDGVVALLKVESEDDHSKNSHDCQAEYQLFLSPGPAGAPVVVDLLTSDAAWNRNLSLRLYGFSQDGRRVFGTLAEDGKFPFTTLFDYDSAEGKVHLIDLRKKFAHIATAKCTPVFDVLGTTATGAIVVEVNSATCFVPDRRWVIGQFEEKVQ
ncbi:MAG: hypothetical protein WB566_00430, partial [Terriglobales bacterium]